MLIVNKKEFTIGLIMAVAFIAIFAYMWTPSFEGVNAFKYSDKVFNAMAKDSSYQVPSLLEKAEGKVGSNLDATFKADDDEMAQKIGVLFEKAGADVTINANEVRVSGDLGLIAKAAITDVDEMYKNNNAALTEKYGYDSKEAMYYWWESFERLNSSLQKAKQFEIASYLTDVKVKAVEPGYNFNGIVGKSASDNMALLSFLLVFYVAYTMLWGFAIYFLFEGVGVMMVGKKH